MHDTDTPAAGVIILPTPPGADEDAMPGTMSATEAVMRALQVVIGHDRRLPRRFADPRTAPALAEIQGEHLGAALRQLRVRYSAVNVVGREFAAAHVRGVRWADELAALGAHQETMNIHAHATLAAALTRRLVIDGLRVAERTVATCRKSLTAQNTVLPAQQTDEAVDPD